MSEVVQQIVNWLSVGSTYALLAVGVAVLFSVLGLINFAHGELVTLTGYAMLLLFSWDVPWPLVFPAAVIVAGVAAALTERIAVRPLRDAPPITLLISTLALSIIIQNALLLFVGARSKAIGLPEWTSASLHIGDITLQWLDVATLLTTIVVLVVLTQFLRRSVLGLALRAAAEDFHMTRAVGLPAQRVIIGAFAVSGVLAGVAAIFFLSQASLVSPNSGFTPLLKGFIAAVIGGLGSLTGAAVGGFVLAGLEIFFQVTLPSHVQPLGDAIVFGIVVLMLLARPHGLFANPTAGLERA